MSACRSCGAPIVWAVTIAGAARRPDRRHRRVSFAASQDRAQARDAATHRARSRQVRARRARLDDRLDLRGRCADLRSHTPEALRGRGTDGRDHPDRKARIMKCTICQRDDFTQMQAIAAHQKADHPKEWKKKQAARKKRRQPPEPEVPTSSNASQSAIFWTRLWPYSSRAASRGRLRRCKRSCAC